MWRAASALLAVLLCGLLLLAAQGSLRTYSARGQGAPGWVARCLRAPAPAARPLLARCARIDGRVVWSQRRQDGETHLAVVSSFHLTIVEVPTGVTAPGWGSRIIAIGPMDRARDGQREIQALELRT